MTMRAGRGQKAAGAGAAHTTARDRRELDVPNLEYGEKRTGITAKYAVRTIL
jgi:hypothetical protein